jgi:hypothetical protein
MVEGDGVIVERAIVSRSPHDPRCDGTSEHGLQYATFDRLRFLDFFVIDIWAARQPSACSFTRQCVRRNCASSTSATEIHLRCGLIRLVALRTDTVDL